MIKGQAKDLIMDAAERLFAEQGVEGVSLRAINAAAGVSPGVLHYHFGSREVLVEQLIERRMQPLMARREKMLQPLMEQDKPDIKAIIQALVQPLADFVLDNNEAGQRYVQFTARLYADQSTLLDKVSRRYVSSSANFPKLLQKACPQLSFISINWRLLAANNALLHTLSEIHAPLRPWLNHQLNGQINSQQAIDELIEFIVGGFVSNH